jgi:hypothetical protein
MKSGKQRRIELKAQKQSRAVKLNAATKAAEQLAASEWAIANGGLAIDRSAFASNIWDEPDFIKCGYYLDRPFTCVGCNSQEIWTAAQQKWWYEEAKGDLYSIAKFCRPCRHQEQARRAEARRIHLEGIAKKKSTHQLIQ